MARNSRVLPAPDGPSSARHSCGATSKETGGSPPTARWSTLSTATHPRQRAPRLVITSPARPTGITRKRACDAEQTREAGSDALPLDLALELLDGLLGTRPVGMHFEQLLEGLECRLFLADLAQD